MYKLKHSIDFDLINHEARSKIVKGSVIPRPIAWITTMKDDGTLNLAPFSFFNVISPTLLTVSFQKTRVRRVDSFVNLQREKEAVVHIVDESLLESMDASAEVLGKNESEVDHLSMELSPSLKIKTPGLKDALVRFEVVLEETFSLKDYDQNEGGADLVILRIKASLIDDDVYDSEYGYILADKLKPVARLGGNDYSAIRSIPFERKF